MGEHCALGQAGCAAGVLQDHVDLLQVGDGMGLVHAIVGEQLLERQVQIVRRHLAQLPGAFELRTYSLWAGRILAQAADHQLLQPRVAHQSPHLRVERRQVERDEDIRLTILDLVLEHALGIERRIIDHRAAGLEHAEESDRIVRRIRQVQTDMHARTDPETLQPRGGAIRQRAELPVTNDTAHEVQRRTLRPARHGVVEDLLHRHQRQLGVPAHACGIRLGPGELDHDKLLVSVRAARKRVG